MPCLSSRLTIFLKESISVSNAVSQLALPLRTTAVFGVRVVSSPNGSAVWTGAGAGVAGASAAGGGVAGAGVAGAAGAGATGAAVSGAGVAGVGVAGDCASAGAEISASAIVKTGARRKKRRVFIRKLSIALAG